MRLATACKVVGVIGESLLDRLITVIQPQHWLHYDYRKRQGNMQDCDSIAIRHSDEYSTASIRNMPLYDEYADVMPEVLSVLRQYYDFGEWVAFLARLKAGGEIGMHADHGEFLESVHRVHIPVITNPDCFYLMEDGVVHMARGTVYEIDNQRQHGVLNSGKADRVQLVVNLYPTKG